MLTPVIMLPIHQIEQLSAEHKLLLLILYFQAGAYIDYTGIAGVTNKLVIICSGSYYKIIKNCFSILISLN